MSATKKINACNPTKNSHLSPSCGLFCDLYILDYFNVKLGFANFSLCHEGGVPFFCHPHHSFHWLILSSLAFIHAFFTNSNMPLLEYL